MKEEKLKVMSAMIDTMIEKTNGYMAVSEAPNSQYARGWNSCIRTFEVTAKQLKEKIIRGEL